MYLLFTLRLLQGLFTKSLKKMELFYRQAGFLHDIKSDASEPQKGSAQHVMHLIYDLYVCKDFVHELFETCNMKPCCLLCKAFVLVARSVQFQPTSQRWQLPDLWEDVWL